MTGTSSTITLDDAVAQPIVCSEASGTDRPTVTAQWVIYQFSPIYNNTSPGGLFEVDGTANASIVDASLVSNHRPTFATTSKPIRRAIQVACYPINALGTYNSGLREQYRRWRPHFLQRFEGGHVAGEPWVSINTVAAPTEPRTLLGYVMQIHNASSRGELASVVRLRPTCFSARVPTAVSRRSGASWLRRSRAPSTPPARCAPTRRRST